MIASYTNSKKENVSFVVGLNNYQFATYLVNKYMLDNDIKSVFHMVYFLQVIKPHCPVSMANFTNMILINVSGNFNKCEIGACMEDYIYRNMC